MKTTEILEYIYKITRLNSSNQPSAAVEKEAITSELKEKLRDTPEALSYVNRFLETLAAKKEDVQSIDIEIKDENITKHVNAYVKAGYCRPEVYAALLPIAQLAYTEEKNGVPEEHAFKLATLFSDASQAIKYLETYQTNALRVRAENKAKDTFQLMHEACSFRLPVAPFPEFKTLWQKFAKVNNFANMLNRDFLMALANGLEITQLIKIDFRQQQKNNADSSSDSESKENKIDTSVLPVALSDSDTELTEEKQQTELQTEIKEKLKKARKEFKDLDRKKDDLSEEEESKHGNLSNYISKLTVELSRTYVGTRLEKAPLQMILAYYERYKSEAKAEYAYFLKMGLTANDYNKFETLDRSQAGNNIPAIFLDGAMLEYPGYYIKKLNVQDGFEAAQAATLGRHTDCCQSLSGESGEPCTIHGLTSPDGGFYVLCKKVGDKPNREKDIICAQSWAWRSQSGALVLDSIEYKSLNEAYVPIFKDLAKYIVMHPTMNISHVMLGTGGKTPKETGIQSLKYGTEIPRDYSGYRDSEAQTILAGANNPLRRAYADYTSSGFVEEHRQELKDWIKHHFPELKPSVPAPKPKGGFFQFFSAMRNPKAKDKAVNEYEAKKDNVNLFSSIPELKEWVADCIQFDGYETLFGEGALEHFKKLLPVGYQSSFQAFIEINKKVYDLVQENNNMNEADLNIVSDYIKQGAFFDFRMSMGMNRTLLSMAIMGSKVDFIKLLVENGADIHSNYFESDGAPILYFAISWFSDLARIEIDFLKYLISKGADIQQKTLHGSTPLMAAVKKTRGDHIAKWLVYNQNVDIHELNDAGENALFEAVRSVNIDMASWLIELGIDINVVNKKGGNVISVASHAYSGWDIVPMLVKKGCKVNARDTQNNTPLIKVISDHSIYRDRKDIMKLLIAHGADLEAEGPWGTAVTVAINAKKWDVVELLIVAGAKLDKITEPMFTSAPAEIQKLIVDKHGRPLIPVATAQSEVAQSATPEVISQSITNHMISNNTSLFPPAENDIDKVCKIVMKGDNHLLQQFLNKHAVDFKQKNSENQTVLEFMRDQMTLHVEPGKKIDHLAVINTLILYGAPVVSKESLKSTRCFQIIGPVQSDWTAGFFLLSGAKSLKMEDIKNYVNVGFRGPEYRGHLKNVIELVQKYGALREKAENLTRSIPRNRREEKSTGPGKS